MRNFFKIFLVFALCLSVLSIATWDYTFNTATPAGTDNPREADDQMREIKSAVQERMNDHAGTSNEGDHYWPLTSTSVSSDDAGQHRMVTLRQMTGNPSALSSYTTITDLGFLFQKNVGSNGELFYQDEAANVVQLTTGGLLGGGNNIRITSTLPIIYFDESDQVDPAGDYRIEAAGDSLVIQGRNTANNAYNTILSLTREGDIAVGATTSGASQRKITGVANPSSDQDVATKKYIDDKRTPSAVTAKTVSLNTRYQVSTTKPAFLYLYAHDAGQNIGIQVKLGPTNADNTVILITEPIGASNFACATVYVPAGWYFEVETTEDGTPVIVANFVTLG